MPGVKVLISNVIFLIILNAVGASVQVRTNSGIVEGIEVKSILKDEKYHSFFGIPYGEPPVGSLRFMVRVFDTLVCNYKYLIYQKTANFNN